MNIRIVRVDLKRTNELLERIALALEAAVGISQPPDVKAPDESSVTRSTEADLLRADMEAIQKFMLQPDESKWDSENEEEVLL